ncbi:uncharacterized protein LOC105692048 [Athalia rosae]|uniref:uncharacterized protein LOC105692048 n=1 Tax=Athalia rosae TaxID=37344 RepID=UPI0020335406|nr:uncharacterized protein LOC105692048 [Athalia rosae]
MAKSSSGDVRRSRKSKTVGKREGRVGTNFRRTPVKRKSSSSSVYGSGGRRYALSGEAQKILSTVLEDMIEETLEDARKLAQNVGKNKLSVEEVETAMLNFCQRMHPRANNGCGDNNPLERDGERPERKSRQENHECSQQKTT